jgi:hypothetical protein
MFRAKAVSLQATFAGNQRRCSIASVIKLHKTVAKGLTGWGGLIRA